MKNPALMTREELAQEIAAKITERGQMHGGPTSEKIGARILCLVDEESRRNGR